MTDSGGLATLSLTVPRRSRVCVRVSMPGYAAADTWIAIRPNTRSLRKALSLHFRTAIGGGTSEGRSGAVELGRSAAFSTAGAVDHPKRRLRTTSVYSARHRKSLSRDSVKRSSSSTTSSGTRTWPGSSEAVSSELYSNEIGRDETPPYVAG